MPPFPLTSSHTVVSGGEGHAWAGLNTHSHAKGVSAGQAHEDTCTDTRTPSISTLDTS